MDEGSASPAHRSERRRAARAVVLGAVLGAFLALVGRSRGVARG